MKLQSISTQTLHRIPLYLNYLRSLPEGGSENISATAIAEALGLNDVQVRKDLAQVSSGGRPKIGYVTKRLIADIEEFMGYNDTRSAIVAGAGNLGRALFSYGGFSEYGLELVAAFDVDASLIGTRIAGKPVLSFDRMRDLCQRMKIRIGIITVPADAAQQVCDQMVESGILAIWNFAPVHLNVPEGVLVRYENIACSLAVLAKRLNDKL
ncbi:MAG: redox-sensing transcriptional repressor Rex, partial [Christensenellaceae bacterium]